VKPPPFEYEAPATVEEALPLLGMDSVVLAGGQSLLPLLNLRFARPEVVVDLNRISSLAELRADDGVLRIGAMTRQAALERSDVVRERWPLLLQAVGFVGHPQIRSRGTVGGSAAYSYPAAELPAALLALGARFELRSGRGARMVAAEDFFLGPLMTALEEDELLVEIGVPALPDGCGTAFVEHSRTHGDFATAGVAAVVGPAHAAIVLLGAESAPRRASSVERALLAGAPASEAAALVAEEVEGDHQAALVGELARQAIEQASR
jgi:CO/xanthine dehydrogenase FAD-binding subunit